MLPPQQHTACAYRKNDIYIYIWVAGQCGCTSSRALEAIPTSGASLHHAPYVQLISLHFDLAELLNTSIHRPLEHTSIHHPTCWLGNHVGAPPTAGGIEPQTGGVWRCATATWGEEESRRSHRPQLACVFLCVVGCWCVCAAFVLLNGFVSCAVSV